MIWFSCYGGKRLDLKVLEAFSNDSMIQRRGATLCSTGLPLGHCPGRCGLRQPMSGEMSPRHVSASSRWKERESPLSEHAPNS